MSEVFFLAVIAMLLAAFSLSYAFYLNSELNRLKRDQQRGRLLNQMTECTTVIGKIMQDMNQYEEYSRTAFGDNPQDIPNLTETLIKIENLRASFSDYTQETSMEKLQEATGQIDKVLALMKSIAAKSPRLQAGKH